DECFHAYETALFSRLERQSDPVAQGKSEEHHSHGEEIVLSEIYKVDSLLGSGGQKDVYKVVQVSTGQSLALKELKNSHETQRAMMKNEAVLQAQLTHPNIPIVLSLNDSASNKPIFVERLVSGMSWADVMDTLSLSENIALLQTVSKVVAYVHQQRRIVHGDLKPENVVLGKNGNRYNEVYLVDWGLAVSLDDPELATRMPCGTMFYMPPESLGTTQQLVSPATDVFMLGGILYRILTGKAPYEDACYLKGSIKVLSDIEKVLILPIPSRNEQTQDYIPSELIEIANKALERDPNNRYVDAGAFADALDLYQHRVVLTNRLLKADKTFETLRKRQQSSLTAKSKVPFPIMELVENTNEFRLVRQELSATASTDDALYNDAVKAEREARSLLLESALNTRDYGLTEAQLALGEELEKSLPRELASEKTAALLASFRSRLSSGLAARRRDKLIKWLTAIALCVIVGQTIWVMKVNADRREENAIQAAEKVKRDANEAMLRQRQ
ncbi:MAG: serine/threonine-protein kinase, partial [Planctomycetia bacterium]|nr:serine/threonine-protein kinase [Planctomycetia bacterium]